MYYRVVFADHCYLVVLLVLVAIIGDYIVQISKLDLYRAIFDNITHATIGGISWLVVSLIYKNRYSSQTLFEIVLCTLIASCIDLDHFFAARSFYLKDATNLKSRPPLHSSLFPLITAFSLLMIAYILQYKWLLRFSLIILTAFASHHTRDATRRGFWFYPFGSTPPIPYFYYITLTVAIPYMVCSIMYVVNIEKHVNITTLV